MKKLNNQNSAIKHPLDDILGSRGHIMVLRQLSKAEFPTSHSELLDRTTLSRQGVYDVVSRLADYGIVEYVGSGKQKQVVLRNQYPLADIISGLFEREKQRFDNLLGQLKEKVRKSRLKPQSAWIFGKVAQGMDEYGDPVRIALLGELRTIDKLTEDFRDRLYDADISKKYDITFEVIGLVEADLESKPRVIEEPIILLWGIDPKTAFGKAEEESNYKTHGELDKRSLDDAKVWTKLLKKYPEVIPRAIDYLNSKIDEAKPGEHKELLEWRNILESMSYQRLKKFLESDSERSVRLRQSLPFWQVLNEHERTTFKELKSDG